MLKIFKQIFTDKNGKIVIAQFPNPPLFIAAGFYLLWNFTENKLSLLGFWGFFISITYWAYLEIRYGVNLWRRFLGLLVIVFLLKTLLYWS